MLCALVRLAASCGLAHVAVIWTIPTCTAWRDERQFYFYSFQYYSIVGISTIINQGNILIKKH